MTKFHGSLKILFLAYLTVVFAPTPVLAYDSSILGSRYRSAKAAGMGEQLFQFANEGGAGLYYNPSTISNFGPDLTTEPINVSFYGNDGFFNLNGLGIQNTFQLDTQASTLMDHPGIYVSSGWAYLADFYKKGFAFGILIKGETAAQAYSDDLLLYSGKFQFIPSIGTGFSLIKNVLRIGYSLQWINQASGQREVLVNAPNLGFNQTLMQGCALSHNVGLEYSIAWKTISKMTGVVRNLFGANFSANSLIHYTNNPQGVPPSEPMMLDLAFSGQHRFSEKTFIRYSFGINDAFDANQVPILGRLVAGIELSLIKNFTFRGGWQLGYPTLGLDFEVNSGRHAISLAMFSRDTGSSYHELDVLRFMFQYQFKLGKKEATAARTLRLIMKEVSKL